MKKGLKLDISKALDRAIRRNNITTTQFAKEIGINRSLIQDYLVNRKHPSLKRVMLIADYFELPVEYFIGDQLGDQLGDNTFDDLVKSLRYIYETSDDEKKAAVIFRQTFLNNELRNGKDNIQLINSDLHLSDILELYKKYYIPLTNDELISRVNTRHSFVNNIPKVEFNTYLLAVENSIILSMSDLEYQRYEKLSYLKDAMSKVDPTSLPANLLSYFIDYLDDIYLNIYPHAIHDIDSIIYKLDNPSPTFKAPDDLYWYEIKFEEKLLKIHLDLFDLAVMPIISLISGNNDEVKNNLEILKKELRNENE